MGKCPGCGQSAGPMSLLRSWDNFGQFVCPKCGHFIRYKSWVLTIVILVLLMTGAERLLHWMLVTDVPLWLSFCVSSILAMLIIFAVPRFWMFENE